MISLPIGIPASLWEDSVSSEADTEQCRLGAGSQ